MKSPVIAIAGNARSGKDTLGKAWIKALNNNGIRAKRFAFADELKKSTDEFLKKELGISAFTQDEEEKAIIRPFLVFWGTEVMRKRDDNCWVGRLEKELDTAEEPSVAIITDLRFYNELEWAKARPDSYTYMIMREGVLPANEYEANQNGILASAVDASSTLSTITDQALYEAAAEILLEQLIPIETIAQWRVTYPLSKKSKTTATSKVS